MTFSLQQALPVASMPRVRLLLIEDSAVVRAIIRRAVDAGEQFVIAGAVPTIAAALALLARIEVDLILLDLELPGVDGMTALPDLIAAGCGARVVVVSASVTQGGPVDVRARALGAVDTIAKPVMTSSAARFGETLLARLAVIADQSRVIPVIDKDAYDIVVIGASTGGMHALSKLLRLIPPDLRTPILITQHLPASFMPYFAAQLAVLAGRPCDVAEDRMRVIPGRIVVAPGDAHIRCVSLGERSAAIRLSRDPATSGCMPSVDPMFASAARVFGARALAIVLSGMGRDGTEGARSIRASGGVIVAQDQASSVIWGMPGAVVADGGADAIIPPEDIGAFIAARRRPHAA